MANLTHAFAETEFAYDIYAYGGIDVNHAIPGNQFYEEREMVFPGGNPSVLHGSFSRVNLSLFGGMHDLMPVSLLSAELPTLSVPPSVSEYSYDPMTLSVPLPPPTA